MKYSIEWIKCKEEYKKNRAQAAKKHVTTKKDDI